MIVNSPIISIEMECILITRGYALPYLMRSLGISTPIPHIENMVMA